MRKFLPVLILLSALLIVSPMVAHAAISPSKSSDVGLVELEEVNGYLDGTGARQSFTVYCHEKRQNFEFTYPSGTDYWVKVLGQNDNTLDDFQLSKGEIIILKGGGRFTLVVHSEDGDGAWSCKPISEDAANGTSE